MGRELRGGTGRTGGCWQREPSSVPCWDRLGEESERS